MSTSAVNLSIASEHQLRGAPGIGPRTNSQRRRATTEDRPFPVWAGFCLVLAAALILYARGLTAGYYADDYLFYFAPFTSNPFHWFRYPSAARQTYRPIEAAILTVVQQAVGTDPLPIHLLAIFLHAALAWLVSRLMLHLGFTRTQAWVAMTFMLATQAAVHAVLGIDSLSQVLSALLSVLTVWLVYQSGALPSATATSIFHQKSYWLSVLTFALAILSKETSFGLLLMVMILLSINPGIHQTREAIVSTARAVLPFGFVVLVYFVVRSRVGALAPSMTDGGYGFAPLNVMNAAKNIVLFATALVIPWSTADTYQAAHNRDWLSLGGVGLGAVAFLVVVGAGLIHVPCEKRRALGVVSIFAVMGLFPVSIMHHVSELYVYNALPFVAVLVGAGAGQWFTLGTDRTVSKGLQRLGLAALLVVASSHLISVQRKTAMIADNGRRAAQYLKDITPYVQSAPRGGTLLLADLVDNELRYSIFLMPGFDVLKEGPLDWLTRTTGRRDVTIGIATEKDLASPNRPRATVLTVRNGRVVPTIE